jgi:mannose-6-phosphate isomerase-like protein (cupin superfamily)
MSDSDATSKRHARNRRDRLLSPTVTIARIDVSDKDEATLRRLLEGRHLVVEAAQPSDYRDRVVLKPWGYEYLIFQNEHVAAWLLHIKQGHSTSMHCHPQKKTCLILLSGHALCNTFYRRNYINGMGAVIIEKGVFHSTQALSDEGIDVIEIETPPNKTDLVRLNDAYGREYSGYESESSMQTERLERYNYFYVDEAIRRGLCGGSSTYAISAHSFADAEEFRSFQPEENEYYVPCRGQILGSDGELLVDVGEVQKGGLLLDSARRGLRSSGPLFLLTMRPL